MTDNLFDLLSHPPGGPPDRLFGLVIGIVTNITDPEQLGRVKVRFPWLPTPDESHWARVAVPMAGPEHGLMLPFAVEDEVLVGFEHGDVRFPFVLGALWNGKDRPPQPARDGKGHVLQLRSRSGQVVVIDDSPGREQVAIRDSHGNGLVIDVSQKTVTLRADGDLTLESANGKVVLRGQQVEITAQKDMTIQAGPQLTLKAGMIDLN